CSCVPRLVQVSVIPAGSMSKKCFGHKRVENKHNHFKTAFQTKFYGCNGLPVKNKFVQNLVMWLQHQVIFGLCKHNARASIGIKRQACVGRFIIGLHNHDAAHIRLQLRRWADDLCFQNTLLSKLSKKDCIEYYLSPKSGMP